MRVVILGKGLMLANAVLGAIDAGAEVVGVFRYEQTSCSRFKLWLKDFFNPPPEVTILKNLKLNQIRMKSANSKAFKNLLIALNVDLLIVATWKELLKKEIYDIPKIASVNLHPSLLPKYRGPNPYMQTILHGEKESGVTLHLMGDKFDNGAILEQEKVPILKTDTSKELREKTVLKARGLVSKFIKSLNERVVAPIPQNEYMATYFPNISGEERMLDFTYHTSEEISRTIRALHPFIPTYITCGDKFLVVDPYKFSVLNKTDKPAGVIIAKAPKEKSVTIVCKDGIPICFSNLKLYGAKLFTKSFIKNDIVIF